MVGMQHLAHKTEVAPQWLTAKVRTARNVDTGILQQVEV